MSTDGRTEPDFAGMAVNERLFQADLMEGWEAAARRRDRATMIMILQQVKIADPAPIVDALLSDPPKFGF